jgi:hypothetical protein
MLISVYLLIFEKIIYASGAAENMIPKWAWVSWMFVIVVAILVSILWVLILLNLWIDWFRERSRKVQRSRRGQTGRARSCGPVRPV